MFHLPIPLPSPTFSFYGLNWLDIVIVVVFLFYIYEGLMVGFLSSFFDLLSFILSFVIGLTLYSFTGGLIIQFFSLPKGFANAFGFLLTAVVFEFILSLVFRQFIYEKLRKWLVRKKDTPLSLPRAYIITANQILGIVPGCISAFVLLLFFLSLIASLPFSPYLKKGLAASKLGNPIVGASSIFQNNINQVFGGAVNDTLTFLTVKPEGDEFVELHYKTTNVTEDPTAEMQMFEMVNKERVSRGLEALVFDDSLRDVARLHSKDMFARGYFSHYTPEGYSPFDRMKQAGITYGFAGENLALAPSTDLAMQGLMNSPGHKANILSADFRKVGIGVMDGGIYGEMFSQEFSD